MPAYWVARSKINDPVEYKKYTDLVPAIIAKYRRQGAGARRAPPDHGRAATSSTASWWSSSRPSSRAVACFTSAEYDRAAAFRRSGAGEVETIIVDGGDPTLM